jgi:CobQ-like glutamine amidotransferase family enzyme
MATNGRNEGAGAPLALRIGYLYGVEMNIYGDRGNIIALTQRCRWRGIAVEVDQVGIGDPLRPGYHDLYFFGGGQDKEQIAVAADLADPVRAKGAIVRAGIEAGAAALTICGGYQLFGHYYRPHQGPELRGIEVFDITSEAGPDRFIGNSVVETPWGELVGFENHSALTFLGPGCESLGRAVVGAGNNGRDGGGGAVYRHAYGCYLHGSLLPKNPWFADRLLLEALRHRTGPEASLPPLDDRLENAAHAAARRAAGVSVGAA